MIVRVFKVAAAGAAMAVIASPAWGDDRPLALVEYVSDAPDAELSDFDYIYDGDKVDLRPSGILVIAYFDRCIVETFEGGVIKFDEDETKVSKGGEANQTVRACQTAALSLNMEASTAGASVKRQGEANALLRPEAMMEITTPLERPVFIWPKKISSGRSAQVVINYLDAEVKQQIWTGETQGAQFSYPADAPALERGAPYEIQVSFGDGEEALSGVFSTDPDLDLPASPLNNVIPLGL